MTPSAPVGLSGPKLHERRASLRRQSRQLRVFVTDTQGLFEPFPAEVVDYSEGGLRLHAPQSIPAGTRLSVRPRDSLTYAPWFRLEVVYCYAQADHWVLGCQFVRLPSAKELLRLA